MLTYATVLDPRIGAYIAVCENADGIKLLG